MASAAAARKIALRDCLEVGTGAGYLSVSLLTGSRVFFMLAVELHNAAPAASGGPQGPSAEFARVHAQLLADHSYQFKLAVETPQPPPEWARWIGRLIELAAPLMQWAFWIAVAALAGLLLFLVGRELLRVGWSGGKRRGGARREVEEWRPDAVAARILLQDADALAAAGRYGEAAHLILRRTIQDIELHRPKLVRPSDTSRDIAAFEALPSSARPAFVRIAAAVERSLFARLPLGAAEFQGCRQAYEAFALPEAWRA